MIDVVVCTYNSEKFLNPCLRSIVKNIPVKNLWIIDNFSTDNTKKIAMKYTSRIIERKCSLAEARALSFKLVESASNCSVFICGVFKFDYGQW